MRKLYFFTIAVACAYLLPGKVAARDTCSASFTYSSSGNTVNFYSAPGLPPGTVHNWIFGDGTAGDGSANPVHTYGSPGTFWVKHYIFNQTTNCNDSVIKEIRVPVNNCSVEANFSSYRDSQDCRKIHFINQSTPISSNLHILWKFGDGTTSNETNPTHSYPSDGNYNVCLVVESGSDCRKEICRTIEVRCTVPPCNIEVKFDWKKDENDPLKIWFNNQTIVPATGATYSWSFGDGSGSTEKNPAHLYANSGTYTVCLKVMISNNCIRQECKTIVVGPVCQLHVDFNWRRDTLQLNRVYFTSILTAPSTDIHYEWKFGDGSISKEPNPVHVFEHGGEFEVCLTVRISDDCKKTVCHKLAVRDCDVHAKFESKNDAADWNKVWFVNLSQPISNVWRTSWTYGDGTSSQDFNSVHAYQQPGKYVVCLKVQSLQGCINAYCDTVVVRKPDSCRNHSDFRFEVAPNNPLEIRFKPSEVYPNGKYYWDFGDGKSSTAVAPTHKFDHAGIYRVCLTVVVRNGCRTNTCKEIRIASAINCDTVKLKFEYSRSGSQPNVISFKAISNVPVLKQKWAFLKIGESIVPAPVPAIIEANNPTYTFTDTGKYLVCLYAETAGNCQKVYCDRIHIERRANPPVIPGSPVIVFPNPATNSVRIEFQMENAGKVSLTVLDASGSIQLTFSAMGQAGNNSVKVPIGRLSNGFYMVEIRYANRLKLAKFQKS